MSGMSTPVPKPLLLNPKSLLLLPKPLLLLPKTLLLLPIVCYGYNLVSANRSRARSAFSSFSLPFSFPFIKCQC